MKRLILLISTLMVVGGTLISKERLDALDDEVDDLKAYDVDVISVLRKNNLCLVGIKSRYIRDNQLSSSGHFANMESHSPRHGRLDSNTGVGSWSATLADKNEYQWIQVDLLKPKNIYGVVIEGRSQLQQWVTQFKVQYSMNGKEFHYVTPSKFNTKPVVFQGNGDNVSAIGRRFPAPILSRIFRIVIVDFWLHPSMRFDLLVC